MQNKKRKCFNNPFYAFSIFRDDDGEWGCVRTTPCRYSVCGMFLPGDRHVVLGCKTGHVQLFDVAGGSLLEEVQTADEESSSREGKAVCSICLTPNQVNSIHFSRFLLFHIQYI